MNRKMLALKKETLARLDAADLVRVGGAMPDESALGCVLDVLGCTGGPNCTAGSPCIVICTSESPYAGNAGMAI